MGADSVCVASEGSHVLLRVGLPFLLVLAEVLGGALGGRQVSNGGHFSFASSWK